MWVLISDMKIFWRGAASLLISFWVIGFFITFLLLDRIGLLLVTSNGNSQLQLFYLGFLILAYLYVVVGIWRSATYYQGQAIWAYLAKAVSVLALCRVVLSLIWFWNPEILAPFLV